MVPGSSVVPSANAPVFSGGPPYARQQVDPLQARDPWQSWRYGRQRAVTQALWAQYGPTTTASVRSVNPVSQPYGCFTGQAGDGLNAGQAEDGGVSSHVPQGDGQNRQSPS